MSALLLTLGFRDGSVVFDDLESFVWVLIVTAFWVNPPSSSSDEYGVWERSAEGLTRNSLLPPGGIPSKDWLGNRKTSLLFHLAEKDDEPVIYYDETSRKYAGVIKQLSAYMFRCHFQRNSMKLSLGEDTYYIQVLQMFRDAILSLSSRRT
ncbi:hypothetical protein SISNIDRAFT_454142 [Sistotremastrum niveocremeum HHB9708]|uniref:Uncharacterized protein n=1 Tax=Sistotremastrum niveocremeum HHB9708 TaxID=1314777 RepID=A0A164V150_9AGAM|nr:hypothetical protein SISNIDRAFT_454142 [Sistotremastrum niveocremeum HHB9708]